MIARTVTLRALLIEDVARSAERAHRPAAEYLLRRLSDDTSALHAAGDELRLAVSSEARVAGRAAAYLAIGDHGSALSILAAYCGLPVGEWVEATLEEQDAELDAEGLRTVLELAARAATLPAPAGEVSP